jgi:hypothetical protein
MPHFSDGPRTTSIHDESPRAHQHRRAFDVFLVSENGIDSRSSSRGFFAVRRHFTSSTEMLPMNQPHVLGRKVWTAGDLRRRFVAA